ncbi:MAG: sugar transferase [Gaiellales bacterium]|nr:MAG: sugar transferase [Gaiellales bacterium]
MAQTDDHILASNDSRREDKWSFLPYEQEREIPRREVQMLRAVHAVVIPLVDMVTLTLAVVVSYLLVKDWVNSGQLEGLLGRSLGVIDIKVLWIGLATVPLWMLVFVYYGVYRRETRRLSISTFDELPQTIGAIAVGAWVMFSFLALISKGSPTGRALWAFVAVVWLLLMILVPTGRALLRVGLSFYNPFRSSTLVVGAGEVGRSLIGRLQRHKEYGLRVVGFLDTSPPGEGEDASQVEILGRPSDLMSIVDRFGISRVIIAFSRTPHPQMLDIIHQCQEMKVDVSVVPRFFEALSPNVEMEDIEGLPVISLPRYARHGRIHRAAKRLIDLLVASLATILLSPVLLLVGTLIKLDSPGTVFFKQERMGRDRKRFMMYKFRSMKVGAEGERELLADRNETTGPIFKMKDDPRITRVGRIIRRFSIDELPQVINVFRGEMSIVGPRPLPVHEAEQCTGTADMRHMVQPGITGLWQVLGRSDIPFEEMVQLDYLYVTNWTLRWDIKIILRTFIAIVRKRGAY